MESGAKRNKEHKDSDGNACAISPVVPAASLSDRQSNRQLIQDPSGLYCLSIEMTSLPASCK